MFTRSAAHSLLRRLPIHLERLAHRHILGLTPDPDSWPAPQDCDSIPLPSGIEKTGELIRGWVLDREFSGDWPRRRTVIGAQAFRLDTNGEYDCGWRLVSLAERFLKQRLESPIDIVIPLPPPQIYRQVPCLEWSSERLARALGSTFRPDLIEVSAPLMDHADRLSKLPVSWGDLFILTRPESVFNKQVLICDWRWEKGKSLTALTKLLRHAGAEVVCFAWME
jgi:hypothetical protein